MRMINAYDYSLDVVGSAYGLANIQTILGIIVLILTIFNILFKMCVGIYKKIKEGKIEEISDVVEEAKNEVKEVGNNEKSK